MEYLFETYTYKIVDKHKIQADVYRIPGKQIHPVIIWIHAGALIFGTRKWLPNDQLDMYLKAGYTVVSIDHRLAPETKLPDIIDDLKDAYTWAHRKGPDLFNIDPNYIAVVGHSAGGYLALVAGYECKPKPNALVVFYGYGDLTGDWYARPDLFYNQMPRVSKNLAYNSIGDSVLSFTPTIFSPDDRYQFYLYCRQHGLWPKEICGHDPEKEQAWFSAYEPLRNITSAFPPTILLHGEKDTDVPFDRSVLLVEALELHGVECEFITDPHWEHMFDGLGVKDGKIQRAFEKVLLFLEKHLH